VSTTSIFACRDPRGSHWQLGALPPVSGHMTLIGWRQIPESIDAGVPKEVAAVLARALTSVARVTFPTSVVHAPVTPAWSASGDDLIRDVTWKGLGGYAKATLKGLPKDVVLISTRQPTTAMGLFDDARYPWWLQGQLVMLSPPDAAPPDIDLETLGALLEQDWTRRADSLAARRIDGILRPGVDGDVAGLLSFANAVKQDFLASLERESRLAGFEWAVEAEDAFAERLTA
jgi:hypothetical protein